MSQQTELERVKGRIRALAARTVDRGCSEAEALAAAQKIGEILEIYGLTMSEVELRQETCIQRQIVFSGPRLQALGSIFLPIIELTETKGWMVGRNTFVFYGLVPDVLMAEYLLQVVARAVDHEEAAYRASEAYRAGRATPQNRVVAPLDRSVVPFERMQDIVNYVWAAEGLQWPPRVRPAARRTKAVRRGKTAWMVAVPSLAFADSATQSPAAGWPASRAS